MFDPSSFVNPTPLAHADASRDVLPRGGGEERRERERRERRGKKNGERRRKKRKKESGRERGEPALYGEKGSDRRLEWKDDERRWR
ncbi:hypothetical protein TNCV_1069981 [Trichonephila clavipes]|nr:hypothetical protein TNCV_1069981 [Trichonephila clavipes]